MDMRVKINNIRNGNNYKDMMVEEMEKEMMIQEMIKMIYLTLLQTISFKKKKKNNRTRNVVQIYPKYKIKAVHLK